MKDESASTGLAERGSASIGGVGVVWFVVNEKGLIRKVILPFGVLWRLLLVHSCSQSLEIGS